MPRFRIYCDLYIDADTQGQVEQFIQEDSYFIENHVLIAERTGEEPEDEVYADLREKAKMSREEIIPALRAAAEYICEVADHDFNEHHQGMCNAIDAAVELLREPKG